MKRLLMIGLAAAAAASGTLSVATPASAQHWRRHHWRHDRWRRWHGPRRVYRAPGYAWRGWGCRTRWRWDPWFRTYVRVRYC